MAIALEYPDVELTHMYVDNAAMQLVRNPKQVCFIFCEVMQWFSLLIFYSSSRAH